MEEEHAQAQGQGQDGNWMGVMCGKTNTFAGSGQPTDADTPIASDLSTQKDICIAQIAQSNGFKKKTALDLANLITFYVGDYLRSLH